MPKLLKPIIPVGLKITALLLCTLIIVGTLTAITSVIVYGNINSLTHTNTESLKNLFIIQFVASMGILSITFFFRKYCDFRSILSLGFQTKGKGKDLVLGLLLATIIVSIGTIILIVNKDITITGFNFDTSNFFYGFLLFVTVALSEEILCRGYILNNLMGTMNKYYALAISSAIFALMHSFNLNLSWFGMFDLFIAGILLGSTYIYTKNLWFPISFHLFWNFIQGCVFDYNVSGLNVYSIFRFDMPIKNSFNGGDFGFEGSWLCTLLSSCTIIIILYYYKSTSNK